MNQDRITYINFLMDELHETNTTIYELLTDREFEELDKVLEDLIIKLHDLKESIQDN